MSKELKNLIDCETARQKFNIISRLNVIDNDDDPKTIKVLQSVSDKLDKLIASTF